MDALRRENLRKALTKLYIHIRLKVSCFPVAKAWGRREGSVKPAGINPTADVA